MIALKIKAENSTLPLYLYFDAITTYQKNYPNTVTRHPVEDGSNISDHLTQENMILQFSGIISNADFNTLRPTRGMGVVDTTENGRSVVIKNLSPVGKDVSVVSKESPVSFLPNSITQFLSNSAPNVQFDQSGRPDYQKLIKDEIIKARNKRDFVTVLEFGAKPNTLENSFTNMIITSLVFDENADSGDALFVSMVLEQVRVVKLSEATVDGSVVNDDKIKDQTEEEKKKGGEEAELSPGDSNWNNCVIPASQGEAVPEYCKKYQQQMLRKAQENGKISVRYI
jgi:hypothetical protein